MDEEIFRLPVDDTLTVHTAYQRGFKHAMDVGQDTPRDLLPELSELVKQKGYKLGKARYVRTKIGAEKDRGLYEPLKKTFQQQKE